MAEELSQRSTRLPLHAFGRRSLLAERLPGGDASLAERVAQHPTRWEQKVPHRAAERIGVWQLRRVNLC
jgi:hypothetical protein